MFYKYRTLDNFQFLLDIIVNKRLFAAKFDDMNDPMEGVYTFQGQLLEEQHVKLANALAATKFCSLSRLEDDPLMWAHYANGNRGCVIGVELQHSDNFRVEDINYTGPSHIHIDRDLPSNERAVSILTHKSEWWAYEEEVRVFALKRGNYIEGVTVHSVIIGEKADQAASALLRKIIESVAPSVNVIDRRNNR